MEDHPLTLRVLAICLAAMLASCVPPFNKWFPGSDSSEDGSSSAPLPATGKTLLMSVDNAGFIDTCTGREAPRMVLTVTTIRPHETKPGETVNHNFVYRLCPKGKAKSVKGRLTTSITTNGRTVVSDTTDNYTIDVGLWSVNSHIVIPEVADKGEYTVSVEFTSRYGSFQGDADFVIR